MAINYPGPWEVRTNYQVTIDSLVRRHQVRASFESNLAGEVGEPFTEWFPINNTGSSATTLDALMSSWITQLRAVYNASCTFIDTELWKYTPGTFDAQWYSVKAHGLTGTSVGTLQKATESILTFRTSAGGTMRYHLLESVVAAGKTEQLPLANTDLDAIADAILSTSGWFKGRDGGVPKAFLGHHPGQNERLFKELFR